MGFSDPLTTPRTTEFSFTGIILLEAHYNIERNCYKSDL